MPKSWWYFYSSMFLKVSGTSVPNLRRKTLSPREAEVHSLSTVLMARKNKACLPDKENETFIQKDL